MATGPVLLACDRLVQHQPLLTSVVSRAAICAQGLVPPTAEGRALATQGVVGLSFRTNDLVRSVRLDKLSRGRRIISTDLQARAQGASDLLFDSAWTDPAGSTERMTGARQQGDAVVKPARPVTRC